MDNTNTANTNVATEATEAPKLSRRERLLAKYTAGVAKFEALRTSLQELADELNSIDALAAVDVGSKVVVTIGRAETLRTVEGTVIGVREDEDGSKAYKVQYGEGFDADIAVVKGNKLALPTSAPVNPEAGVEQSSE